MNPVLCGLANEILLATTGSAISLHGITFRANQVIELGEFNYKGIVVVLEKGLGLEPGSEHRF